MDPKDSVPPRPDANIVPSLPNVKRLVLSYFHACDPSLSLSLHPTRFHHPLIPLFSPPLFVIPTKSKHTNWNFTGPVNNCTHLGAFHLRAYTLYPKPPCFMHNIWGGEGKKKYILEISCLIWVFVEWECASLFGPSARRVLLFALIQLLLVIFDISPRVDFFPFAPSLSATDDRLLSRCKLTFPFHN